MSNASATTVINNLYQTSSPSLSTINFPNIAVNHAKKTAICNWINALRMVAKIGS